ncbi:MAG: hypothetical protein ABJQ29_13620 [Luteolibacter sp.]
MISKTLSAALAVCSLTFSHASEERSFKSSTGQEIKASFEGLDGETVTLRRADGKVFDLPLDRLSKEDQEFVKKASEGSAGDAAKINQAAGLDFSTGKVFSQLDAETVATALKLKPESTSKHGKSWRLYASFVQGYTLFGAMPYSVALYSGEDGKVENISVVYANKGDYGSTAGFARDHFKSTGTPEPGSLEEAMNLDEKTVATALTSVLGEAKEQRYGESGTRRTIKRWDWKGHAFLLSNEEGEYVSLSIVSTEMADNDGKSERLSDAALKQRLTDNVVREDNGDVYISEIPMVDQGPKGYCVPATFERAMRTMGIDADMYLLAMVGQSQAGGGTITELLLENVKSAVYRKGRRTKEDAIKNLKIRDVKRYIDEGSPVMWSLCSMDEYNDLADENTAGRAAGDPAFREEMNAKAAKIAETEKPADKHHICMIIGYNEGTNEIAVSDSWGKRFEKRWVPLPVADWASAGKLFMILP